MTEQYAREIIASGADFQASLWGDDPGPVRRSGSQTVGVENAWLRRDASSAFQP